MSRIVIVIVKAARAMKRYSKVINMWGLRLSQCMTTHIWPSDWSTAPHLLQSLLTISQDTPFTWAAQGWGHYCQRLAPPSLWGRVYHPVLSLYPGGEKVGILWPPHPQLPHCLLATRLVLVLVNLNKNTMQILVGYHRRVAPQPVSAATKHRNI